MIRLSENIHDLDKLKDQLHRLKEDMPLELKDKIFSGTEKDESEYIEGTISDQREE